jgi:hypothetical protein
MVVGAWILVKTLGSKGRGSRLGWCPFMDPAKKCGPLATDGTGLHFLRRPVYPDRHAAGKIADNFRRIVLN